MPQNTDLTLNHATAVDLTNEDVTAITVQNKGPYVVALLATAGTVPTVSAPGAIFLPPNQMLLNEQLSDLWPGVPTGTRVFGWTLSSSVKVMISHG